LRLDFFQIKAGSYFISTEERSPFGAVLANQSHSF